MGYLTNHAGVHLRAGDVVGGAGALFFSSLKAQATEESGHKPH